MMPAVLCPQQPLLAPPPSTPLHACVRSARTQTAAGKTFTMSGDPRNYSHRGIIPRALQHAFREVDMRSDRLYRISVSFLEIYNDSLRDLLAEDPAATQDSLAIVDDAAAVVVCALGVDAARRAGQGVDAAVVTGTACTAWWPKSLHTCACANTPALLPRAAALRCVA
jgi:hypothetical protein